MVMIETTDRDVFIVVRQECFYRDVFDVDRQGFLYSGDTDVSLEVNRDVSILARQGCLQSCETGMFL